MAMTAPAPTEIASLVHRVVLRSASVAADAGAGPETRRNHAGLCYSLSHHVEQSERLCADVVGAALRSIDDHHVVRALLEAAETLAPDALRLVAPVSRLCAVAHGEGRHETVAVGLCQLARWASAEEAWGVPDEWFASVSRAADKRRPYFCLLWFRRFGGAHPGFRRLIRDHEEALLAKVLPAAVVRGIHAAEPTITGWIALARQAQPGEGALGLSFGDYGGQAITTLRDARDGATDDAVRERLSQWLAELEQS